MSIITKTFCRRSFVYSSISANYSSVSVTDSSNTFVFKSNFSNEEQLKILNTLNQSNPNELSQFNLSRNRIKNLENWRTKNGSFKSLNDVLEVEGLGEKVLEKICANIITETISVPKISKNNLNKRIKHIISPPLVGNIGNEIKSAVGVHLGPTGLSWAKLSKEENRLTNWNYLNFTTLPKKMTSNETFDLAIDIVTKIPPGDLYVFESNSNMPQGQTQSVSVPSYTQQLELASMLLALINTSPKHNLSLKPLDGEKQVQKMVENRVYYLRSKIPARLFRTLVGTERVSAITTVAELIDENVDNFSLPCTAITLDQHIRNNYNLKTPANKELLAQALMLIISFMELCLYKNPRSLNAIAPGKNK